MENENPQTHEEAQYWTPAFKDGAIIFSPQELLHNSFFYPACGRDFSQIKRNYNFLNSFIYADYSVNEEDVIKSISNKKLLMEYDILVQRKLEPNELPNHGTIFGRTREFLYKKGSDNAKLLHEDKIFYTETQVEELGMTDRHAGLQKESWGAIWIVLKRKDEVNTKKPEYLSLIFISADAVCVYKGLYADMDIAPHTLGLIQYGRAFGGAYTYLDDDNSIFGNMVLNSRFSPQFLIYGVTTNWDNNGRPEGCFKETYSKYLSTYVAGGNNCYVWQNSNFSAENYIIVSNLRTGEKKAIYQNGKEVLLD